MLVFMAVSTLPLGAQIAKPNAKGVSMGHLHIVTTNPEAHKKLWVDTLGGKPGKIGPLEYIMFPDAVVALRKGEPSGGTDGSVVDHLGFLVPDLDATRAKLTAAGAPIVRELPATRQMFAMFPDGVKVEFTEQKDLGMPIRHHHVHFASHQVDEMREWYGKMFDAVPRMRGRFKTADVPGVNLSWNPAEKQPVPSNGRAVDHIGFEVTDIKAFCANLEAAGVKLDMKPTPRPELGLVIAFLTDPWGAKIELTEGLAKYK
jgi:catechol 2,3-dioxygenase-like lactoylglutathione lyase family enzyme